MKYLCQACATSKNVANILNQYADPMVRLALRLFVANIFFASGWLKFSNYLNDNWAATIYLFTDEHPVPFLPPAVAAVLGTGGELAFSILLAFGLFGRFAALGLLIMTAVIQFTYQASNEHILWALCLATILSGGAGALSIDGAMHKLCPRICGSCGGKDAKN